MSILAIEKVREYFAAAGMSDRVLEFAASSATVELAAEQVGCEPARIAKTLSFAGEGDGCILVMAAGDARVDNKRFRAEFGIKPRMLPSEEVELRVGHAVGGVCPFAVAPGAAVYLDCSLRRFDIVYPAAGSSNSAVRLSLAELEQHTAFVRWVDVCKNWRPEEAE